MTYTSLHLRRFASEYSATSLAGPLMRFRFSNALFNFLLHKNTHSRTRLLFRITLSFIWPIILFCLFTRKLKTNYTTTKTITTTTTNNWTLNFENPKSCWHTAKVGAQNLIGQPEQFHANWAHCTVNDGGRAELCERMERATAVAAASAEAAASAPIRWGRVSERERESNWIITRHRYTQNKKLEQ